MSAPTLEKAAAVVEAARSDPSLAAVVEEMDETGKVEPAYRKAVKAKRDASLTDEERAEDEADRLRILWSKQIADLARIISHDPAKFVPLQDPESRETMPGLIGAARKWLDSIETELGSLAGLRVVTGGRGQ